MEENLDLIPKEDLFHDARLLLPEHPNPEGYVAAIVDCDLHSDCLPVFRSAIEIAPGKGARMEVSLDILQIIGDFCELPPMLPHIHSFIDALWDFNRGEA